jgi:putative oxidoreductase
MENHFELEMLGTPFASRVLSIARIMIGLLLLQHATAKFFGFPHVAMFNNLKVVSLIGTAGVIELIGGVLFTLGLFTRPVAFVLSGLLAFAYFIGHAPRGFYPMTNGGEAAVLFCFIFLYYACAGGGPGAWTPFCDASRSALSPAHLASGSAALPRSSVPCRPRRTYRRR